MKEFVEKLIERMKEKSFVDYDEYYTDCGECLVSMSDVREIVRELAEEYKHKYVSIEVYKQVAGERDIAIEQLHELGYEFGQKIN